MPKYLHSLKLVCYDKNDFQIGSIVLKEYSVDKLYHQIYRWFEFFSESEFSHVFRVDVVSSGRVLFVFLKVRSLVNQNNFITINLKL